MIIGSTNPLELKNKGESLSRNKNYKEAIIYYNKAIEINAFYYGAYNSKGYALQGLKQFNETIQCYDQAIQINSKYSEAYKNKGLSLCFLNKFEEALICYEQAIKLDPQCKEAYENMGLCLIHLNKNEQALVCYQQLSSIDSSLLYSFFNQSLLLKKNIIKIFTMGIKALILLDIAQRINLTIEILYLRINILICQNLIQEADLVLKDARLQGWSEDQIKFVKQYLNLF